MIKIYRVLSIAALFLVAAASFADVVEYKVGKGEVLNELSEADALKLTDTELLALLAKAVVFEV